jgi:hypothetical protein
MITTQALDYRNIPMDEERSSGIALPLLGAETAGFKIELECRFKIPVNLTFCA